MSIDMRRNLRLIKFEAVITVFVVGAVETLYLQMKGYTLGQIGFVHATQTAVIMLLNVPLGYLADKTSRRMCNLLGDATAAAGIIGFAFAGNLFLLFLAKVITGIGIALSAGADTALLKVVCDHLGEPFAKHKASIQSAYGVCIVVGGIIVGITTTRYPTAGILLAAAPFLIGAVSALFIKEVKAPTEHTATRSIKEALSCCWSNKKIRWATLTGSTIMAAAGVIQDLAVPLAKEGGVPSLVAGGAWSYYFLAWSLGAWLYKRMADTWEKRTLLMLPVVVVVVSLGVTAIDINEWTVSAFLFIGTAHGWLTPQLSVIATEAAPSELRATVISIYMTVIQLTFIAATLMVLNIASISISYAIPVLLFVFAPLLLLWSRKVTQTV